MTAAKRAAQATAVALMALAGIYGLAVLCYFMACATIGCDPSRAPWPHW